MFFMKFGINFGHFVCTIANKMKPRGLRLKIGPFRICPTPIQNENCANTLAKLDDILQKVVRDYSLAQNPTVVNRMAW